MQSAFDSVWCHWPRGTPGLGIRAKLHGLEIIAQLPPDTLKSARQDRSKWPSLVPGRPNIYIDRGMPSRKEGALEDDRCWTNATDAVLADAKIGDSHELIDVVNSKADIVTYVGGFWTVDGYFLSPKSITVDGGKQFTPKGSVAVALKLLRYAKGTDTSSSQGDAPT